MQTQSDVNRSLWTGRAVSFSPLSRWGPGRAIKLSAVPFCLLQIIKLCLVTQGDQRHPALIHRHQEVEKSWKFVLRFNCLQYYTEMSISVISKWNFPGFGFPTAVCFFSFGRLDRLVVSGIFILWNYLDIAIELLNLLHRWNQVSSLCVSFSAVFCFLGVSQVLKLLPHILDTICQCQTHHKCWKK